MSDGSPVTETAVDGAAGLRFRETMAGPFAMGVTDPQQGADVGRRTGWRLALHSTITIDDMRRFVADPHHPALLQGELELPGVARRLPFVDGRFNLFAPSGTPDLTLLKYEAGFEHGGERYYFAGRKDVRDDLGLDLWSDTTTLPVRLHQGVDASGPVVGAGIVGIGVVGLLRMLASMRPVEVSSPLEAGRVFASFGRLFAANLRDSYLLRPRARREAREAATQQRAASRRRAGQSSRSRSKASS